MSTLTTTAETTSEATAVDVGSPGDPVDHEDLQRAPAGATMMPYARLHQRYAPLVHGILLAYAPLADVDDAASQHRRHKHLHSWRIQRPPAVL